MIRTHPKLSNRSIGLLFIVAGVFIAIAGLVSEEFQQIRPLYISGYSEQIASQPSERTAVDFSVTLHNPGSQSYPIVRIVPIVSERAAHLILQEPKIITAGDRIDGGDDLTYYSRLYLNTGMMTEDQIAALHPIIHSYVVSYDNHEESVIYIRK